MMTIRPGYGVKLLHLRQSQESLLLEFGEPELRRESGKGRSYWLYPRLGFECIVSARSQRVLSLFLHPTFALGRLEELSWDESVVLKALGHPPKSGGGFDVGSTHVDRWFSYDSGIGFHFDSEGKITTVSVFQASRKQKAKTSSSYRPESAHALAAMSI